MNVWVETETDQAPCLALIGIPIEIRPRSLPCAPAGVAGLATGRRRTALAPVLSAAAERALARICRFSSCAAARPASSDCPAVFTRSRYASKASSCGDKDRAVSS